MLDKIRQLIGIYPIEDMFCVTCHIHTKSWRLGYEYIDTKVGIRRRVSGKCKVCKRPTSAFVATVSG